MSNYFIPELGISVTMKDPDWRTKMSEYYKGYGIARLYPPPPTTHDYIITTTDNTSWPPAIGIGDYYWPQYPGYRGSNRPDSAYFPRLDNDIPSDWKLMGEGPKKKRQPIETKSTEKELEKAEVQPKDAVDYDKFY